MTLNKIENLEGKWISTSHDSVLLYDAVKLFDLYESNDSTVISDNYFDIKDLEFTVNLTGTVTDACCDHSPLTTFSGSETISSITMHDFYQSNKNVRSDICLCYGINNDQVACTMNFSMTKCSYN